MELVVRFEQLFGGNEKWLYRQYLIPREQTSVQNSFFYVPRVLRLKKRKKRKKIKYVIFPKIRAKEQAVEKCVVGSCGPRRDESAYACADV